MSMISAQIDELRDKAEELRAHGTFTGFGGLTSTDPLMLKSATIMRDAADTIWELRDMVHKERAEADKLRELVLHMYTCMGNVDADGNHECFSCEYEGAECDYADRMSKLGIEVDDG